MANNYKQATVEPIDLPRELFTKEDLCVLELSGFEWEKVGEETFYFFAPEFLSADDDVPRTYVDVFQDSIRRSGGTVTEIVVEGAYTCSKMRPGEFGGFVIRITESAVQTATTGHMLGLMRNGIWPLGRRGQR